MNNSLAEVHPELVLEWSEKSLPDIMIWRQQIVSFLANGIMKRINGSRQKYLPCRKFLKINFVSIYFCIEGKFDLS